MRTSQSPADDLRDRFRPLEGGVPVMPWLWLGTWSLGGEGFGPQDLGESRAVLREALAAGVRHIDTAGFYARGRSEELVAEAIRDCRRQLFVSTKGGLVWEGRNVRHRARPSDLRSALHQSLRSLGTDYIDLFQLHWPDPGVPVEESLGALQELREEGLIRFWGAGNLSAAQLRAVVPPGARVPHQVPFNPVHRTDDLLAAGAECERCLSCAVSPFEQGLLADGVGAKGLTGLGKRDARRRNPRFGDAEVLEWVAVFQRLADQQAYPRALVVLLWILSQAGVHVVVPGPRRMPQLRALLVHLDTLEELGLPHPDGNHTQQWQQALQTVFGGRLWAHLQRGVGTQGR